MVDEERMRLWLGASASRRRWVCVRKAAKRAAGEGVLLMNRPSWMMRAAAGESAAGAAAAMARDRSARSVLS